jgi:hypothetical protein
VTTWPPADLPGLHIDLGQWNRAAGTWLRVPTADYRCTCGWTEAATTEPAIRGIGQAIRAHRLTCPNNTQKETA